MIFKTKAMIEKGVNLIAGVFMVVSNVAMGQTLVKPLSGYSCESKDFAGNEEYYALLEERSNSATGPKLWGAVLFSGNWDISDPYNLPYGLYSFPAVSTMTMTPECVDGYYLNANGGGVIVDDIFNYVSYQLYSGGYVYATCYQWNVTDNCYVSEAYCENPGMIAMDVTYDKTDCTIYGIYYNSDLSALEFATADYSTATKQKISDLPLNMRCIAADGKGRLLVIDSEGKLYEISKTDGSLVYVGDTHVMPLNALQSATIDPRSGKLFWSTVLSDSRTALYEVDTETAVASLVSYFPEGEQVVALSMSPYAVVDEVPDYPENVTLTFEKGSTEGTIQFEIPEHSYVGAPLSGNVQYKISIDDEIVIEGNSLPGKSVIESLSVQAGQHIFSVILGNSYGDCDSYNINTWIGFDILRNPTDVVLSSEAKDIRLIWDKPAETVHGGYVSDEICYDVVRYPEGVVVAEKIHDNIFEETLLSGKPVGYYYEVIPYNGNVEGLHGVSNKIVIGDPYGVPYEENFDTVDSFNSFTLVDANKDNNTWIYVDVDGMPIYVGGEKKADDWLLSPEISFLDDRLYEISFDFFSPMRSVNSSYEEKISAYIGEGLSIRDYELILDKLTITNSDRQRYSTLVSFDSNGSRHIGFRAVSEARQWRLAVDSIKVTESVMKSSPDAVNSLTVIPGVSGETSAEITFVAPTRTAGGLKLDIIDKIEIIRNGQIINTFVNPGVGEKLSFKDILKESGNYEYKVVAYNSFGAGLPAFVETYVGTDFPCAPSDIIIKVVSDKIMLSWCAPENGINGGFIDPASLTYDILDESGDIVKSEIHETSALVDIGHAIEQRTVRFYVRSVNSNGIGEQSYSPKAVVGESYSLPYHESFADGVASTLWWREDDSSRMLIHTDDATSSDKDGYNIKFEPKTMNNSGRLTSGKINLREASNPILIFHHYCYDDMSASLIVEAETADGNIIKLYEVSDSGFGDANTWIKNEVSLDDERLKEAEYVYIRFIYSPHGNVSQLLLDNINIHESTDNNITPYDISAMSMEANTMSIAYVKILNTGRNDASDISVDYFMGDKLIRSSVIEFLRSNEEKVLCFKTPLDVTMPEEISVHAEISYSLDEIKEDNMSEHIVIDNSRSYPLPTNVTNNFYNGKNYISWDTPIGLQHSGAITDGFEDYNAFAIEGFGDWKTLDGDKGFTNGIVDVNFPHNFSPFSFIVFNASEAGVNNNNYYPYRGTQCLTTFGTAIDWNTWVAPQCDDWLISPALSGNAQTISFYGKSWSDEYGPETIEVLYSVSGNETSDFISVGDLVEVSGEWTLYMIDLPKESKYFAIHVISQDKFMFMLDDVTYEKGSDNLVLEGYNIYDSERIVASLNKDCNSFEYFADKSSCDLYVSARYNAGESSRVMALSTGIIDVKGDNVTVSGQKGAILVRGASGQKISVYNMEGRLQKDIITDGDSLLYTMPGVYLVKVGNITYKVVVF